MTFESFNLKPSIAAALKAMGFVTPTPIQSQAIPHVLAGRDVLGLAQTGTGKTAAFALPILHKLSDGPRGVVRALVIAPTRELADQIHVAFEQMGRGTGLRSVAVYGGMSMAPQMQALRGRCEIVVACPGRLLDHVGQGIAKLGAVEMLVLDEADQMFDMGFLPQIRKIVKAVPAQRQTMLFSATMPEDIRSLAHECLKNPVTVQIRHTEPLTTVAHALYPVHEHLKTALLMELLKPADMQTVLVFTRTKRRAAKLARMLEQKGLDAAALQGNMSQSQRKRALDGFRDGSHAILVATDIASRGIDVSQISHVVNFDVPMTVEAYTHRIGRTGRAARTGDAFTLVTGADDAMVKQIERRMGRQIERRTLPGFDYGRAPQHVAPQQAHVKRHPPQPYRAERKPQAGNGQGHGPSHAQPAAAPKSWSDRTGARSRRNNRRRR